MRRVDTLTSAFASSLLHRRVCDEVGRGRRDAGELCIRMQLLDFAQLQAEQIDNLSMGEGKAILDGVYGWTGLLRAVGELTRGISGRGICCRCCQNSRREHPPAMRDVTY